MSQIAPVAAQFSTLSLPASLLSSLGDAGFSTMTEVQELSLPAILNGEDVVVEAATGSGKTAAFALGLLAKLDLSISSPQALVLCPTRELAEQVADAIRLLAKVMGNVKVLTLCGGVPAKAQAASLEHGAQVLVGTPGRIVDHLSQKRIDFSQLQTLVLDEADRMLEMGFQDQLNVIVEQTPRGRQSLLFSATFPPSIAQLTRRISTKPKHIKVATVATQAKITQRFYSLEGSSPTQAIEQVLLVQQPRNCMVFCNTKAEAQNLVSKLHQRGFSVLALHGDLEQKERDQAMVQFVNGSARVLIATDVAARGLDIAELDLVISVHMAHDLDTHTHRIGRTGRAGAEGLAIALVSAQDDYKLRLLEDQLTAPVKIEPLPTPAASLKPLVAEFTTMQISGGKKDKLRPGDIVGALTRDGMLSMDDIGKIKVQSNWAFVAVHTRKVKQALALVNSDRIKGKRFRAYAL